MPPHLIISPFRPLPTIAICTAFCLCDSLISIFSFGLYHENGEHGESMFQLNYTQLWHHLTLQDGYHFSQSPFDFFPLQFLRSLILLSVLLPIRFASSTSSQLRLRILNYFLMGAQICNFSYSLIKLLAFSDDSRQLNFPGVWLNVFWNIAASVCLYGIYNFWLFSPANQPQPQNISGVDSHEYQPLVVANQQQDTSSVPSVTGNGNGLHSTTAHPHQHSQASITSSTVTPLSQQIHISTWAHIRSLLRYCMHYWHWLLVGFIFLVIYSVARVFVPLYTSYVISDIVRTKDMQQFFKSVLKMSSLLAIATFFGGLRAGTLNYTTAQIERLMRLDLFRSVTSQEMAFFDQAQTGEILSRLIADCETMSATISTNVNILLRNGLMVLGSVVFMFSMSWRLTTVTLIVIPPIAFFTKLYSAYYDHLSARTQECKANANRIAEEVVSSMRNVRAFACEHREQARFQEQLDETLDVHKKKSVALCGFQWVNELANNCILVAILCYGGYLVLTQRMTADQMFAFLLYQLQLGENFYMLNSVVTGLMECVGASRKVFEYLQRAPRIQLDKGTLQPPEVLGKVEFRNVHFSYPTRPNTMVLKDVSFQIRPGEMVALVGPSGAGKSSVISLLEHFYEPLQGQILLDDRPIEEYDHRYFHHKISLVSQEPILYAGTIRENILYGCDEDEFGMDEVVEAAKQANIHQFIADSEQGYETKCGEKGVQMSGGQKQRIAIARALIRRPAVLILDEATSALDAESEHVIQEALIRCTKDRTVLLIAHRLSTVERADRIIVLDAGRILQVGSHRELMAQPGGLYHSLVKRQLLGAKKSADRHQEDAN